MVTFVVTGERDSCVVSVDTLLLDAAVVNKHRSMCAKAVAGLPVRPFTLFPTRVGTASFDVFCVKISVGASAVGERKNQKNEHFPGFEELYFTHMGRKKILHGSGPNFALGRYPGRIHRCKFWERLVKGF